MEFFTGSGIQHLTGRGLSAYRFPCPPVEEQLRIVSRVAALMSLCGQLEAALAAGDRLRSRLLDSLLAEALASAQPVPA